MHCLLTGALDFESKRPAKRLHNVCQPGKLFLPREIKKCSDFKSIKILKLKLIE